MTPLNDGQLLDTILNDFTSAISGSWGPSLSGYLLPLLMALVVLQFGMMAVEATITRDVPSVLMHLMLGIIRVGIVVAIFNHAFDWGQDITQTFQQIGVSVAGLDPTGTGPSEVFNYGGQLATSIMSAKASGGWLSSTFENIEFLLIGLAVASCWVIASLIYLGTLIEVVLLVFAAPLVICVTPLSWTFDLLVVLARSILSIGFKVTLILMTLGVGIALALNWEATTASTAVGFTTDLTPLLIPLIESAILVYVVWKVPSRLSGMVPGAAILGFGEAVGTMASGGVSNALHSSQGGSNSNAGGSSRGSSSSSGGSSQVVFGQGSSSQGSQATAQQMAQQVQSKLTAP